MSLLMWIGMLWVGVALPAAAVIALLAFYDGHSRPSGPRVAARQRGYSSDLTRLTGFIRPPVRSTSLLRHHRGRLRVDQDCG